MPYFHFEKVRIPGVLQRIALCTLLAAPDRRVLRLARAAGDHRRAAGLYSVLMLCVPVPGIGAGVLLAGPGLRRLGRPQLLGSHLWVQSKTWDPEGLVSTLPAVVQPAVRRAGRALAAASAPRAEQTVWMLLAGLLLPGAGRDRTPSSCRSTKACGRRRTAC